MEGSGSAGLDEVSNRLAHVESFHDERKRNSTKHDDYQSSPDSSTKRRGLMTNDDPYSLVAAKHDGPFSPLQMTPTAAQSYAPSHSRSGSEDSSVEADRFRPDNGDDRETEQSANIEQQNHLLLSSTSPTILNQSLATPTITKPSPKKQYSPSEKPPNEFEEPTLLVATFSVLCWAILAVFAIFRDFLRKTGLETHDKSVELERQKDFVELYSSFEASYTNNIFVRFCDNFNRPICSTPGATVTIKERKSPDRGWTMYFTGKTKKVINFGSYNYLGFAEPSGPCADASKSAIQRYGVASCSPPQEIGRFKIQRDLEGTVAKFVGAEDSICFPMGFATNSTNIVTLAGKGCLVLSDELNHASLIVGCKLTGATKRLFKHNNMQDLEKKLHDAIIFGQPRTRRPFRKILIIVEGIYSMEGSIVNLPKIIELKKRYKAYLWLDEAHSIGAMGPSGRGVVEYWGCDPLDVDILMGTFTKSFGSCGGYIAGRKDLIDHIRCKSGGHCYGGSMSPATCQQIISSMNIISGLDGTDEGKQRIATLSRNARYFRRKLKAKGYILYGNDDSPVIPLMLYMVALVGKFNRDMLNRFGIATVTVGFPATPLTLTRARFCVSSAHTKEMIDQALEAIEILGDEMSLRHSTRKRSPNEDVMVEY